MHNLSRRTGAEEGACDVDVHDATEVGYRVLDCGTVSGDAGASYQTSDGMSSE